MASESYISDIQILKLIEILKEREFIRFDSEFCRKIDLKHQNLNGIRNGVKHFTPQHIENVCKEFDVNANWIFGFETKVFN